MAEDGIRCEFCGHIIQLPDSWGEPGQAAEASYRQYGEIPITNDQELMLVHKHMDCMRVREVKP